MGWGALDTMLWPVCMQGLPCGTEGRVGGRWTLCDGLCACKGRPGGTLDTMLWPVCMQGLSGRTARLREAIRSSCRPMAALHSRGFGHPDLRWPSCLRDAVSAQRVCQKIDGQQQRLRVGAPNVSV
jgi:hypothetical protein